MSGDLIGKGIPMGAPLGTPAGFLSQMAGHDPKSDAKFTLFCGSSRTPVLRVLPGHRFYLVQTPDDHFLAVSPKSFPFYLMVEHPGEIKVFVISGPLGEPVEVLQQVTKTHGRRDILFVLKDLATKNNNEPIPLHEIDILDVAARIADGRIKLT